ncbi:hypothetical protein Pcinc_014611 [Petrolisthes cinctipes]|uniref:DDE-1 domain-containing protein n=1 Tax=Petrolisthes cinctipes TaxID=88211 RepID=A0AAE1FW99_PETCI|nr:hypothetical protein Pcinc_014611 [Petrolisthes cinctipes]
MDQGVIRAVKRCYTRKYHDEVLVVLEDENDETADTRGERTKANIKAYNIRSALYNLAYSWADVKVVSLANYWKPLLTGEDIDADFEGFEANDFHKLL